jgi:hypothetical protein
MSGELDGVRQVDSADSAVHQLLPQRTESGRDGPVVEGVAQLEPDATQERWVVGELERDGTTGELRCKLLDRPTLGVSLDNPISRRQLVKKKR